MATVEELTRRLNTGRTKAQEIARERSRLTGESDGHKRRLAELEQKCQDEFQCGIDAMPEMSKQVLACAEKSVTDMEVVLGLRQALVATVEQVGGEQ